MLYSIYLVNLKVHIIEGSSKFIDGISFLGDHRCWDSGDIMFLVYHMTSLNHMLKDYVDLWVKVPHDKSPFCITFEPLI